MTKNSEATNPFTVVKAIHKLKQTRGVTAKDIVNYIVTHYGLNESTVKRQMYNVLQKGLNFGLLSHCRGYYRINYNNANNKNLPRQFCVKPMQRKPKKKQRMKSIKRLRRSKRRRTKANYKPVTS